jgi:hypothetical protein
VCATRTRCRRCAPLALGNEPDDRQQQPLVRRASVALVLRRPTPRTTSETHAWLTALSLEQQALAQSHLPAFSGARIRATSLSWRSAKRLPRCSSCDLVRCCAGCLARDFVGAGNGTNTSLSLCATA